MNQSEREHLNYYQNATVLVKQNTLDDHQIAQNNHKQFCREICNSLKNYEAAVSETIPLPTKEFLTQMCVSMSIVLTEENRGLWEKTIAVAHARFLAHKKQLSDSGNFSEAWKKNLSLSDGSLLTVGHFAHRLMTVENDVKELKADVKLLIAHVKELMTLVMEIRNFLMNNNNSTSSGPSFSISHTENFPAAATTSPAIQKTSPLLRASSRLSGSKRRRHFQDSDEE